MTTHPKSTHSQFRRFLRTFTREEMQDILTNHVKQQRPLKEWRVNMYQRKLDLNLWLRDLPGEIPVMFDWNRDLLNGRHRMTAGVRSKAGILTALVITGLDPKYFATIDHDIGVRSSSSAHPGYRNISRDKSRVRQLSAIVDADPTFFPSEEEFTYLAEEVHRKQVAWASEILPRARDCGAAAYAAALMYVHPADAEFAVKVGRAWADGGGDLPKALRGLRDAALRNSAAVRGGKRPNPLDLSFKMLSGLAYLHRGGDQPRSELRPTAQGLRYWSSKLNDGAAEKWAAQGWS